MRFLWCGQRLCEKRSDAGSVLARYYAQGEVHNGQPYYYAKDQVGSVVALVDARRRVAGRLGYDAYGHITHASGTLPDYRYAGLYYHPASGLELATYRAYDPETARWLSRDPAREAGGINLYRYVGDNPISRIDPMGLSWWGSIVLTAEWATGTGPQHQNFGPNSSQAAEMRNATGVLAAEALFRRKNAQKIKNHCDSSTFEPVTNYASHFGLKGLFTSGLNPTEQFIGSYRIDIYPAPLNQMEVVINNTSSFKSFGYGIAPAWDRSQFGPLGNISQTIRIFQSY